MKRPLVFGIATFSIGMVCGFFFQSVIAALLIALSVFAVACYLLKQKWWVFLLAVTFFTAGLLGAMAHIWTRPELPRETRMIVEGRVLSVPKEYDGYGTTVIKSEHVRYLGEDGEIHSTEKPLYFNLNYTNTVGDSFSIGDSVRAYAEFRSWSRKRICGTLNSVNVTTVENRFDNAFVRFSRNCSEGLGKYINKHYSGQTAALLTAILTGDQSGLSKETQEAFRKAGMTHLIAVSGMNISILLLLFTYLAFFIPRRWRLVLSLPLLLFLVIFTGAPPSILRAAIMSATFLLADIQGRDSDALTNLFVAAGVLILLDYDVLYDVSFQLSFTAVLGLILGMPLLTHPFFQHWFGKVVGSTMMAQLGALPITIGVFGGIYPYATLTNLAMVPIFPMTIGLCLGVIVLTWILPPLGQILLPMSENAISVYLWVAKMVAKLPGAEVDISDVCSEVGVFLACAIGAGYLLLKLRQK